MNAPADGVRIEAALRALHDDAVPSKTARGREEMSQRRGALRPRLRSLLLLADGQRSLADLRHMATQTGGAAQDVDELLREGYIELPLAAALVAPAAAATTGVAPLASLPEPAVSAAAVVPVVTEVVAAVASPAVVSRPSSAGSTAQSAQRASGPDLANPLPPPAPNAPRASRAPPSRPTAPSPAPVIRHDRPETTAIPVAEKRARSEPPDYPTLEAVAKPAGAVLPIPAAVFERPDPAAAAAALDTARALLLDWLSLDGPRANRRLRSLQLRIEQAADTEALVALIEETESTIPPARRSHQGLLRIEQLREVLGLGNTRVAEDTLPGVSADEAGAWASTLPGE